MAQANDQMKVIDYVSRHDKDTPSTTWMIAPLSSEILAWIVDTAPNGSFEMSWLVFILGVLEIRDFRDARGNPVASKTEIRYVNDQPHRVIARELAKIVPLGLICEVGKEILKISNSYREVTHGQGH